jgi:predicted aminopeptidase
LLAKSEGNLDAFYASVKQLANSTKAKRDAQLAALMGETTLVSAR